MVDVVVRGVPEAVVAAIDAKAARLGISRVEYLRRRLAADAARAGIPVSAQDLRRFASDFGDLADPTAMDEAWR